jgi:hypothetical protein
MEKTNKFCQSCGMPMNKDPKGGSTNADGSINLTYCSYCYENGQFHSPDMTLEEMKTLVKTKLKEMGVNSLMAWFFTLNIPRLERWRKRT